jgi:RNA polymerase sigma factor (sigma-70 family)
VRDRSSIAAWLAIVASNETLAYLNRKGVENRLQPISLNMKLGRKELLDILPCRGGPGEELAKKDLCERLVRAVGTLPRKEMLIMKLILFHDKKYREIAEMLNMPKGTVSNYMKRAKGRLKIILKDY